MKFSRRSKLFEVVMAFHAEYGHCSSGFPLPNEVGENAGAGGGSSGNPEALRHGFEARHSKFSLTDESTGENNTA